jgi:Carboxypeptidase regulatory-like domain/TonB dependent receptor/TonB-dependent Receptor Plug Domain
MNWMVARVWRAVAGLSMVLLLVVALRAQSSTGSMIGSVTDASGAAVAGASIAVKNVDTGVTQNTTSDAQGRYRVPELLIGNYEVQATQAGFQTVVRKGITLTVGSEAVIDITLPVGQSQQTVTVEAEASQVDTTSAAVASLVESTQMRELPLNGRNFEQLMTLAPGVQALPQSGGALFGNQTNVSIAGSRTLGTAYLIDNTNFAGFFNHGTGSSATGSSLGIEAIAEFQTLTNTYSAQFGGAGGAVNAVTKSGTNAFHGSAYEFLRNSALDARNFFDKTTRVPPFKRNQFGGSIGGPIVKDKTFFFVNFESLRQGQENTLTANVPDANAKQGLLPCGTAPTLPCNLATGLAFVGIAPNMVSTLAAYQTAPTSSSGGIGVITTTPNNITNENYLLVRVDHTISTKDSLFLRYVRDYAQADRPAAPASLTQYIETDSTANHFATTEWKHIVSPTVVNLARFSFLRPVETGVTPQSVSALQWFPGQGRPDGRIAVAGLTQIGPAQQNPFGIVTNRYDEGDDVIWTKGAHDMRFGFNVDRIQDNLNIAVSTGGQYTFTSLQNLMLGIPSQFTGPPVGQADTYRDVRELRLQPYFQDQWKFSRKLTLNIGARYEWAANPSERLNKFSILINPPYGVYQPVPHAFLNNPTKWNFEPRFGLAYDPFSDHKTSVRVGFAMYRDLVLAYLFAPGYLRTPPFLQFNQQNPTPYGQPFLTGGAAALPSAISGSGGLNADYPMGPSPYMMQYNLNIQRDLGKGMIFTVGYVGSKGVHLLNARDLNPPTRTFDANGRPVFATLVNGKITSNPRLNPNFGPYQSTNTWGNSNYNSLQTSLNRRFSNRWQTQISYTFSKSIDSESGPFVATTAGANTTAQDPYNFSIDKARSSFDRTHAFRFSGIYSVQSFSGRALNAVAGGWQISGLLSAVTGPPFTVNVGFDQAGLANQTPRASLAPGWTGSSLILGDPNHWYDVHGLLLPPVGQYGNLGRGTLIGPDLLNTDLSLSKSYRLHKLSEVAAVQFRADVFNLFNRSNFDLPNNQGGVSFVAGPNGTGTYDPTAGQITKTTTSSRQMQFALKLTF